MRKETNEILNESYCSVYQQKNGGENKKKNSKHEKTEKKSHDTLTISFSEALKNKLQLSFMTILNHVTATRIQL